MKTAIVVLIVLLLVGGMAASALLLVGTAGDSQEGLEDMVVDSVLSNVDGHPAIDAVVDRIPSDCLKCH